MTLSLSSHVIVAGSPIRIIATLPRDCRPNSPVRILTAIRGRPMTSTLRLVDALCRVQIDTRPPYTSNYRVLFEGDETYAAGSSPIRTVGVRPKVTLSLPADAVASRPVILRGTTFPAKSRVTVNIFRRLPDGRTVFQTRGVTDTAGRYAISTRAARGRYQIYATVAGTYDNLQGYSPIVTLVVN